jgi:hypothetical protein
LVKLAPSPAASVGGPRDAADIAETRGPPCQADEPAFEGPIANGPLAVISCWGGREGAAPRALRDASPRPRPRPWPRPPRSEGAGALLGAEACVVGSSLGL